jgi:hypothetical protein
MSNPRTPSRTVTLRSATPADRPAVIRVARLDSQTPPVGACLFAELDGVVVAALDLETGRAVADPFVATADVVELLRRRERLMHNARRTLIARRDSRGARWPLSTSPPTTR